MKYIYIDESGDLGFSEKSSRYFIIACAVIDDDKTHIQFKRIPKKVKIKKIDKKTRKNAEIKFSNSSPHIRKFFLEAANRLPIRIYALILNKKHARQKIVSNIPVLYNYLIGVLLENASYDQLMKGKLTICLDRCMSRDQIGNFEMYAKTEFLKKFNNFPDFSITHESSSSNECLQVVDFICSAFGYKYNRMGLRKGCDEYTKIFQGKIALEYRDFFKEK